MKNSSKTSLNIGELESYILDAMQKWQVPGLSIAIVKGGKTVLSKGYGIRENGKDLLVDEHTLFALSGATVSFTASALAILVGEGKMDWNDRLIDLLPGFKTANDQVSNYATVIDALSNRTGLSTEPLSFFPHPDLNRQDLLAQMKHVQSVTDFRSQWGVDFLMNTAVGEIIPALTDTSWDDFVRDHLFEPIGMRDGVTGPHLFSDNVNVAMPHDRIAGKAVPVSHAQTSNIGPAISIYSSAEDMVKWLIFQLNNGKVGDKVIIPECEVNRMRSSYIAANFEIPGIAKNFINQGLGLYISDSSMGYKIYSNGGDIDGMEAYHAFVPELNLGIAVMVNAMIAMPQPLIGWIIDRYTDAPRKDWVNDSLPDYVNHIDSFFSGLETRRNAITDNSKKLSLAIELYAGLYRHPLLGDLEVQVSGGKLSFRFGTSYKGELLHTNNDTFFINAETSCLSKFYFSGPAQFRLDQVGRISSLFVVDREFQKIEP